VAEEVRMRPGHWLVLNACVPYCDTVDWVTERTPCQIKTRATLPEQGEKKTER